MVYHYFLVTKDIKIEDRRTKIDGSENSSSSLDFG